MDRRDKLSKIALAVMALVSIECSASEYSFGSNAGPASSFDSQLALGQADTSEKLKDLLIVRSDRFSINYSLDPDSLKYISRIELWCGRDLTGPWQLYDYDMDRTPPVDFKAPSEGVWRFLVVPVDVNGIKYYQGNERVADKSGAIPATIPAQTTLFIDYTPPQIFLHNPIMQNTADGKRQVVLQWNVFDSYLGDAPVQLLWQEAGMKEFQLVANSFKAFDGFIWQAPSQIVNPVIFKLRCRDKAGNIQEKISQPISMSGTSQVVTNPYSNEVYALSSTIPISELPALSGFDAGLAVTGQPEQKNLLKTGTDISSQPQKRVLPEIKSSPDTLIQPAVNVVYDTSVMPKETQTQPVEKLTGRALDYIQLGHDAYQRGEYERARMLYEQVLAMEPDYTPARYHLADVLYLQGKVEQARKNFEIFLAKYPQHRKALSGLMYCHLKLGNLAEARDILENKLNQINDKNLTSDLLEK